MLLPCALTYRRWGPRPDLDKQTLEESWLAWGGEQACSQNRRRECQFISFVLLMFVHTAQKHNLWNCNHSSEARYNSHMFKGWRNFHPLPRKYRKHNRHKTKINKYLFPMGENTFCCRSVASHTCSVLLGPAFYRWPSLSKHNITISR